MQITRRHLLALSAATAAAGALGTGSLVVHWWNQPATKPYTVLHAEEAAFVTAWSDVAFPSTASTPISGGQAGLDRFFDGVLQRMPTTTASLLRVLINGLNAASIPLHGRSFVNLSRDQQLACFESWTHSDIAAFRSANQGLVLLLGMGWSTHPEVSPTFAMMHSCGYGA